MQCLNCLKDVDSYCVASATLVFVSCVLNGFQLPELDIHYVAVQDATC